jgi:hypothetical protein
MSDKLFVSDSRECLRTLIVMNKAHVKIQTGKINICEKDLAQLSNFFSFFLKRNSYHIE